mgnify:CR=1 FL=1
MVALIDSEENAVNRYTYDAFGVILASTETVENPFRYAGYWYDSETGLYYLMARYYNPVNGRFLSEDPARDGYNWYVYCDSNPSIHLDLNGQFVQAIEWICNSPLVQQILQYISNGISYAWTSASSFAVQNWYVVQQAAHEVSLYGSAIVDSVNSWFQSGHDNQVQQVASEVNNKTNNASNSSGKNSNGNNTSKNSNSHNPKDPNNWNKNSVKVNSKELYNNKNIRIDVENPNPGQRPGQVHLQIKSGVNKGKYIFDNVSKKFYDINTGEVASKNIQEYLQNPDIINAIDKGLTKYLGVGGIK